MKTIVTSMLDLRNNLGSYLSKLGSDKQQSITITKRGKTVGIVLDPEMAEEFIQWQKTQELKTLYYTSKAIFKTYGEDFKKKQGVESSDPDTLVEAIVNA